MRPTCAASNIDPTWGVLVCQLSTGSQRMVRTLVSAALVCAASWVGLLVGAGNVGLQRSVSIGPLTLFEHPLAIVLATGAAFVVALAATAFRGSSSSRPLGLVGAVLAGDAIGAVILAPLAVGELTPLNAPVVLVALAVVGLQPLAVLAGTAAPRVLRPA